MYTQYPWRVVYKNKAKLKLEKLFNETPHIENIDNKIISDL